MKFKKKKKSKSKKLKIEKKSELKKFRTNPFQSQLSSVSTKVSVR